MKWTLEKRQQAVSLRRTICEEIAQGGPPYNRRVLMLGERLRGEAGLSAKNIRKFFDKWNESGRKDSALDPYAGLFVDKDQLLAAHNLTEEEIKRWFKAKGTNAKEWAEQCELKATTVHLAISGKRVGPVSQVVMDRLVCEIRGTPTHLLEEIAALREREDEIRKKRVELERRLKLAAK